MIAYNDDKTYIKIEREANNIFMVTAIPVNIENVRYVVETMKNVTKNMFYIEKGNVGESEVYELIKGMNKMALTDALTGG
jgi:two-component system, cell cycle response regulator